MPTARPETSVLAGRLQPSRSCFLWIVFAGCLMQSFAETALCTILGGDERAIHLERPFVRTHRERIASKTETPLFISLALHPAKPSNSAGYLRCTLRTAGLPLQDTATLLKLLQTDLETHPPSAGSRSL